MCNSRLNLSFSVGLISRFMGRPKKSHMLAAKRLLRYVKGTAAFGILFPIGRQKVDEGSLELVGFTEKETSLSCKRDIFVM